MCIIIIYKQTSKQSLTELKKQTGDSKADTLNIKRIFQNVSSDNLDKKLEKQYFSRLFKRAWSQAWFLDWCLFPAVKTCGNPIRDWSCKNLYLTLLYLKENKIRFTIVVEIFCTPDIPKFRFMAKWRHYKYPLTVYVCICELFLIRLS